MMPPKTRPKPLDVWLALPEAYRLVLYSPDDKTPVGAGVDRMLMPPFPPRDPEALAALLSLAGAVLRRDGGAWVISESGRLVASGKPIQWVFPLSLYRLVYDAEYPDGGHD